MIMAEYNFVELQSGFYMRKSSQSNDRDSYKGHFSF